MLRLSVNYPPAPGSRFRNLGPHLEMSHRLLNPLGLVRTEIDREHCRFSCGHTGTRTMEELASALNATASELIVDELNYTDIRSVAQISEVVEP